MEGAELSKAGIAYFAQNQQYSYARMCKTCCNNSSYKAKTKRLKVAACQRSSNLEKCLLFGLQTCLQRDTVYSYHFYFKRPGNHPTPYTPKQNEITNKWTVLQLSSREMDTPHAGDISVPSVHTSYAYKLIF